MLEIERVPESQIARFRELVESYWIELMPKAAQLQTAASRDRYFRESFSWDQSHQHPWWALLDDCPVGFLAFSLHRANRRAQMGDFYVAPSYRRRGYGSEMVGWLFTILDHEGVEQIDLNVRRDNPAALEFWQTQGFGIAGYRMRVHRDPHSGTSLKGSLSSDF